MYDKRYTEALLFEGRISNLICELEIFEKSLPSSFGEKFEIFQTLAHLREADINMEKLLKKF